MIHSTMKQNNTLTKPLNQNKMKRLIFEITLFSFWCFLLLFFFLKLLHDYQIKRDLELQQIEVQFKKFKFGKEKDLSEDKTISQQKLETIDRIYKYQPID